MSDSTNPNPADTGAAIAAVDDALARLQSLRDGLLALRALDEMTGAHAAAMARWTPAVHPEFTVAATAASDPDDFTRSAAATLHVDLRDADRVEFVEIEGRYYVPADRGQDRDEGIWPDDADPLNAVGAWIHFCAHCGVGQNAGYIVCPDCGNPTGSEGPSA